MRGGLLVGLAVVAVTAIALLAVDQVRASALSPLAQNGCAAVMKTLAKTSGAELIGIGVDERVTSLSSFDSVSAFLVRGSISADSATTEAICFVQLKDGSIVGEPTLWLDRVQSTLPH